MNDGNALFGDGMKKTKAQGKNRLSRGTKAGLKQAAQKTGKEKYVLKLYITGMTPRSVKAVANIQKICQAHLNGQYELEIIDIYKQPILAKGEQIIAAPTLIKKLPLPIRKFIGDMSDTERILLGLDLRNKQ